jgi:hypothetical protein
MSDLNRKVHDVSSSPDKLTAADRRLIVKRNLEVAKQTGSYAYSFAHDGDRKVEIRVHPPVGRLPRRVTIRPVTQAGDPVGRRKAYLAFGLDVRLFLAVPPVVYAVLEVLGAV